MDYINQSSLGFEWSKKLFPVNKEVIKKEFDKYLQNSNWDKKIEDFFQLIDYQLKNLGTLELAKQRAMPRSFPLDEIKQFQEYLEELKEYKDSLINPKQSNKESIKVLSFVDFIKANIATLF